MKNQILEQKLGNVFKQDYNMSPVQLLSSAYPEYDWLPWKFPKCPPNFWADRSNHLKFMDWASKELKINDMTDWYSITNEAK